MTFDFSKTQTGYSPKKTCPKAVTSAGFKQAGNKEHLKALLICSHIQSANISTYFDNFHCVNSVRIWSYSGPYFPVFSSNGGKCGPE